DGEPPLVTAACSGAGVGSETGWGFGTDQRTETIGHAAGAASVRQAGVEPGGGGSDAGGAVVESGLEERLVVGGQTDGELGQERGPVGGGLLGPGGGEDVATASGIVPPQRLEERRPLRPGCRGETAGGGLVVVGVDRIGGRPKPAALVGRQPPAWRPDDRLQRRPQGGGARAEVEQPGEEPRRRPAPGPGGAGEPVAGQERHAAGHGGRGSGSAGAGSSVGARPGRPPARRQAASTAAVASNSAAGSASPAPSA